MTRVPGRQPCTAAPLAESALKGESAAAAKRAHRAGDAERIGTVPEQSMQQSAPESGLPKEPTYALGRCRWVNPNAYCAPFNRIRAPRSSRNRRPAGWTAIYITLPKITVEGLQRVANALAEEGQHSPWPKERRRYPRTKSHLVGEALEDFFRKLGFPEFCLEQEQKR
jgi:hypothetical protein